MQVTCVDIQCGMRWHALEHSCNVWTCNGIQCKRIGVLVPRSENHFFELAPQTSRIYGFTHMRHTTHTLLTIIYLQLHVLTWHSTLHAAYTWHGLTCHLTVLQCTWYVLLHAHLNSLIYNSMLRAFKTCFVWKWNAVEFIEHALACTCSPLYCIAVQFNMHWHETSMTGHARAIYWHALSSKWHAVTCIAIILKTISINMC